MLKKLMNLFMVFLIGVFIYNNYIRKQEEIVVDLNSDVETAGVQYNFDGFTVEADKQIDVSKSGSSQFEIAKALFSQSIVKGKTAVVDKLQNININQDVFGINEESGWKFETDQLKYNKKKDQWSTDKGVKAYNEEQAAVVTAQNFLANQAFTKMTLTKNVVITMEDKEVKSNKATFDTETEVLVLSGNVRVKNLNLNNDAEFKEIRGNFPKVTYDMKKGIMRATGSNSIFYDDYLLTAKKFTLFEAEDRMIVENNVKIVRDDLTLTMKKAIYHGQKEKVNLFGRIKGDDKKSEFEADNGEMDTVTENMILTGNVKIFDDVNRIFADKVHYVKTEQKMEAYSNAGKEVLFESENGKLFTNYAIYHYEDKIIKAPNAYRAIGEEINGTGKDLFYDLEKERATSRTFDFTNPERRVIADYGEFDMLAEKYRFDGNVKMFSNSYIITSTKAFADRKADKVEIPGPYEIIKEDEPGTKMKGEDLEYDVANKFVFSDNDTYIYRKTLEEDLDMFGEAFTYDMAKEIATFKNFIGIEKIEDLKVEGNDGTYIADESVTLLGNVKYYHGEYQGETEHFIFDIKEDKVYFPTKNNLIGNERNLSGETQKGEYDITKEIFYGEGFKGNDDTTYIESDIINYDYNTEIAKLTGNVIVEENGLKAESQEIIYYRLTKFAVSEEEVIITKENATLVAGDAKLDMEAQTFEANSATLTTTNGDYFRGDYVYGDYKKNEFDIQGNLNAIVYTRSEEEMNKPELAKENPPMAFAGELAKVFFLETANGEIYMSRGEIKKETEFDYQGMKMNSEFMEFDLSKEYVFGKGDSTLTLGDDDKISAESIYIDTVTEEGTLKENVKIFNISEEAGEVNTRADMAFLDNKTKKVNLEGDVEAYKGETKLTADNGVYDLDTNLLEGKGNVLFTFDFETIEQQEEEEKRTKELNEKIEAAIAEVEIPEFIDIDVNKIELSTRKDDVRIVWESDKIDSISNLGVVNHPKYNERPETVSLKATYTASDITQEKYYFTVVKKHSKKSYLTQVSSEFKINNDYKKLYVPEEYKGIKIKVASNSENINDELLLPDELSEKIEIELVFAIDDETESKKYESKYENNILTFEEVKPENE